MLIIRVRENESIDRALRRYKKKVKNTGMIQEVRERSFFEKPSTRRKKALDKAKYKQKLITEYDQ